jgi:hypothetical protein
MFEKAGKYYADWRDASGKRLRKSFTSKRAALQYESEQRELAHPKQNARGIRSARYSARSSSATLPETPSTKSPKPSSAKLVSFRPTSSAPRTSPNLTNKSRAVVSPIRRA